MPVSGAFPAAILVGILSNLFSAVLFTERKEEIA